MGKHLQAQAESAESALQAFIEERCAGSVYEALLKNRDRALRAVDEYRTGGA